MKKSQIAAQLFTLRAYLKSPGGVDRSFAKLREIGFEAVQVSGTDQDPAVIKKYADANGLTICATHENGVALLTDPDKIIDKLNLYECRHTAFPCPFAEQIIDYDTTLELAKALNDVALRLEKAGKTLSYHNHNLEFRKINGRRILDIIYENAPDLKAEIDTYWVQMGGCNPVDYIKSMPGRQPIFHLKEFGVIFPNTSIMVPVGSGNLDWPNIIAAAEGAGVEWFIIEQDQCQKDPFDSLKDSFNYLKDNFVR